MTNIDAQRIKEIRNNTKEMTYCLKSIAKSFERIADALESKTDMWTCPVCGKKHRVDIKVCPCCGYIPQTERRKGVVMRTLKEIAIELREKYEASETACIWEYSGDIRGSEKELENEIAEYRNEIEQAERSE